MKIRLRKENSKEKFNQKQMAEFDLQFILQLLKSPAIYSMILQIVASYIEVNGESSFKSVY